MAGRRVGPGQPVYVIAEMSANHHQDFEQAVRLIRAAREAGADAVKLQTYTADTLTLDSRKDPFQIRGGTLWDGRTLHELYREACMPWEWHAPLQRVAADEGLMLFSTAYDVSAVAYLESLEVPLHKVASFELVDIPLIERMAQTGKPMILSTGMASLEEIEEAVTAARRAGARDLALLKCTSAYPAPFDEMNLKGMGLLAERFGVPVGLSDHTMGIAVPAAAVALGACIVEKHFTLSRAVPGPDSAFSLEPHELKAMVDAIRAVERAVGQAVIGPSDREAASRVFRRSLFVARDVRAGELFTAANVRSVRPAHGLHTRHLEQVLGARAARDIEAGTPLTWDLITR
jgi:N-acetylneuraminate synthase